MSNIKTIISHHNKALINKSARTNDEKKNCNCRKPNFCPMNGNCNAENVIYQAEVTTTATKETYIGLCYTTFKLRYRNDMCSSRKERYRHATEMGNFIWSLKDRKIAYEIKWRQVKQAAPIRVYIRDVIFVCGRSFSCHVDQKCRLSTAEMGPHRVADILGSLS